MRYLFLTVAILAIFGPCETVEEKPLETVREINSENLECAALETVVVCQDVGLDWERVVCLGSSESSLDFLMGRIQWTLKPIDNSSEWTCFESKETSE